MAGFMVSTERGKIPDDDLRKKYYSVEYFRCKCCMEFEFETEKQRYVI